MKGIDRIIIALFLLLCNYFAGDAQVTPFRFRHLNLTTGLSHNQVTCFLKDRHGFVWIGTQSGLNRYDGNSIKVFSHDAADSGSLPDNYIARLFELPDGRMGVVTNGLSIYDPVTETFDRDPSVFTTMFKTPPINVLDVFPSVNNTFWVVHSHGLFLFDNDTNTSRALLHRADDTTSISADTVTSFSADKSGNNWLMHRNGILERVEFLRDGGHVVYRNSYLNQINRGKNFEYRTMIDKDGDLWIYVSNDNQGIYFFDTKSFSFEHYTTSSRTIRLNTNLVAGIVQDNEGLIWAGTDHGGINLIDKKKKTATYILYQDDEPRSLSQNSIGAMYRDDQGIVWIGTYKRGVTFYHENLFRFPLFKPRAKDVASLPYGDVNTFVEDRLGNLWIGTNGGGLIYFDRRNNSYRQYKHDPKDPNSISSDVIVSLCIDHQQKLWIGTYYGGLNRFDNGKFTRWNNVPSDSTSLSGRSVWEVFEDSDNTLWIGLLEGGVNTFNRDTETFSRLKIFGDNAIQSSYIAAIFEDSLSNMWFGTSQGIDILNKSTGKFTHIGAGEGPNELSGPNIFDITADSKGYVWIGSAAGLNRYDPKSKQISRVTEKNGLPHNTIFTILQDGKGSLWMGSPGGLIRLLNPQARSDDYKFAVYTETDGLQGGQFNENAAYKTLSGELIFGGPNGFNVFNPELIQPPTAIPSVAFVDFQLFQKSVKIGETVSGRVILPASLSAISEIILSPDQNFFSIECAALNNFISGKSSFVYKVDGLHQGWLPVDEYSRKITLTGINPGEYTLRVKAVDKDRFGFSPERRLTIRVLPPFWKTNMAFALYVAILIGILFFARKLIQQREKMKFVIEQERQEAVRMHELDMMKIRFFTNVSHEFRTPLTLILTPLDKLIRQAREPEQKTQFELIQRNAKRLLNLVNQLLDFRKMEVQEIRFVASEGDVIKFIREVVFSFSDLAEKKDIHLSFAASVDALETIFDQDKLEKILFNLLSNAFKFTPSQGRVHVEVGVDDGKEKHLQIDVVDSGIGIPEDKLEKVFERFFQHELPASVLNQGSGIGLSITKEFIRVHNGTITVSSEPGKGSCFTVRIPVREIINKVETRSAVELPLVPVLDADELQEPKVTSIPTLLLVEDNDDFRFYLKDNLRARFNILEAKNGHDAWKLVLSSHPDLVVSDIMMPVMNGMDLCRKIKEDQRVSHIPVILLTARTGEEQKLEGFESGADEYITKPFNFEILESRIKGLIAQRKKFHKTVTNPQLDVKASELKITPLDTKFIENAIRCVEKNISSPDFSVEHLGRELGISRAYLYKKIVALTGKSPLEFIRSIRLQHAAQLLEKSQLTVAEIAYQVGFNNPKYFSRYFKEEFQMLPSQYANRKKSG